MSNYAVRHSPAVLAAKIIGSAVVAVVVLPLMYLLISGPLCFVCCQGWQEIFTGNTTVDRCLHRCP
jgi:hypothetical protein